MTSQMSFLDVQGWMPYRLDHFGQGWDNLVNRQKWVW
ncbi:hypothetical protein HNQ77_004757 [Silvibacterium bohemicum]|uniref:Uncharacterized protein n=1 Tax=Silvibacterium bohemicum TaxID=1577686 RepID=A0A841JZM8_9BACT|nr:hypothetical protein [Silvibacterium bohemicum]